MFLFRSVILTSAICFLAACESTSINVGDGGRDPKSQIVTLTNTNELPDLDFIRVGRRGEGGLSVNRNGDVNGFRWAYGSVAGTNDFLGVAGFYPDPQVGAEITAGSLTYDATYQYAITSDSRPGQKGDITLVARFDDMSVTGAADGVRVNGEFTGGDLDGTVTVGGITAKLDGALGTDGVVGAFAGNNSNHVLVGGFVGCTVGQTCPVVDETTSP